MSIGNLTVLSIGKLQPQLAGPAAGTLYDQLSVNGTVSLSGLLDAQLSYSPSFNDSLWIVNNDGTDAITGTFTGLAQGSQFPLTSTFDNQVYQFKVFYNTDFGTHNTT